MKMKSVFWIFVLLFIVFVLFFNRFWIYKWFNKKESLAEEDVLEIESEKYEKSRVDEEEMLLHINALLRRAKISSEHKLTVGDTILSYDSFTVTDHGDTFELPKKEFMILYKLLSYNNKIFTRRQLMDEIWDLDTDSDEHTVNVHINRLRDRFKDNPDFVIVTVRGLGYKAMKTC